jgi:tetratricopeptide (TPR) repeat protein
MTLRTSLLRQLANPDLNRNNKALLRCKLAREQEDRGNYEDAREIMGELWQRVGEHPVIEKLEPQTAAEVLLRAGVLTGHLADRHQIENGQEIAKNLISETIAIYESLGSVNKVSEAQTELALCYWREGAYDESRIILKSVLAQTNTDVEVKAKAALRGAVVERSAGKYKDAFRILTNAATLFEQVNNHTVKGGYHNELAIVLRNLGTREKREDYIDRAFVEYAAASYHFEEARHKCYWANVENNLGFLHFKAGRFKEAHRHLDYARRLLVSLKDKGTIAQVDETRARVFLAQQNYTEAERVARAAVCVLEKGDRQSLLAEALTTHGIALARLGYYEQARFTLQHAIELAQQSGVAYDTAEAELKKVDEQLARHKEPAPSSGCVLSEEMHRYEAQLIHQALARARGSITQAARLLGITHQRLGFILQGRHKELVSARTPKKHRRTSRFK